MPRKTKKSVLEKELELIYQEEDGSMPDLQNLERKHDAPSTRILMRLLLVFVAVSAVAWAGFLLWSRGLLQEPKLLVTEISGPERVRTGEEVLYTLTYTNEGKTPIASLEAKLNLPVGFEPTQFVPEPTENHTWNLGALEKRSDGVIQVKGVFRAEIGTTQALQALFTYRPGNFSSDFQKVETKKILMDTSAIKADLSGPEKAVAGEEVEYVLNVQNDSLREVQNVTVELMLPADFTLLKTEPSAKEPGIARWDIASLAPGELFALSTTGAFTSNAEGEKTLTSEVYFRGPEGILLKQAQVQTLTDVLGGNLAFRMIVDGSSADQTANPAETLLLSIDYENKGQEVIRGITFTLDALTQEKRLPLDLTDVDLTLSPVERLDPGEKGAYDLTLPLLANVDPARYADRFTLTLEARTQKVGSVAGSRTLKSTPITITLNSNLTASARARYFDGAGTAVGAGELPPKVDQTTEYEIVWEMENTLHALNNVLLSTKLPQDVAWKGSASTDAGTMEFDPETRTVNWFAQTLPEQTKKATARFRVTITPKQQDAGAFFKLTNVSSLEATDSVTGDHLTRALPALTSELEGDTHAAGKGIVEE